MIRKALALIALFVILGTALIAWSYSGAVASVPASEKLVALTYDDGPNPPYTQDILAMLEQHSVRATFFPKARNVEAFPGIVAAILAAGHEIGNHSYAHRPMLDLRSDGVLAEVQRANRILEAEIGFVPTLFRPPFGAQGPGLKRALAGLGMTSVLMSTHGADWEVDDAQQIAATVLEGVESGGIVLLHDGHGDVDDPLAQDSRAATVVATGIIIEGLRGRGYRFVTVGELLAQAGR